MRSRKLLWILPMLAIFLVAAKKPEGQLAEVWRNPDEDKRRYKTVMIVGITENQEARHHFENKFVSHLRARQLSGVTSYPLASDLTNIKAEDEIIR